MTQSILGLLNPQIPSNQNCCLTHFRTQFQIFSIVQAVHYQRTVHAMMSSGMQLCSKTVKTYEVLFCSVIEHGMTPFCFQTA